MIRKVLLQLVLPLIGLSVLFWLLAFAPGDKHYQPALLEMSVILRDGDGNVSAMRKGMEQAAKDLNVELRFLTPAEDDSAVLPGIRRHCRIPVSPMILRWYAMCSIMVLRCVPSTNCLTNAIPTVSFVSMMRAHGMCTNVRHAAD